MKSGILLINGATLLVLAGVNLVQADDIAGLYSTGMDSSSGSPEAHYTLFAWPEGANSQTLVPTLIPSSWITPNCGQWIAVDNNANAPELIGDYTYRLTFDLVNPTSDALDPATASINGTLSSDDSCSIYLNGNWIADFAYDAENPSFGRLSPFTIDSGFVSGANVLDFVVHNEGEETNPEGLLVDTIVGTADLVTPVPEPGTYTLLSLGLATLFFRMKRPFR